VGPPNILSSFPTQVALHKELLDQFMANHDFLATEYKACRDSARLSDTNNMTEMPEKTLLPSGFEQFESRPIRLPYSDVWDKGFIRSLIYVGSSPRSVGFVADLPPIYWRFSKKFDGLS
jgi:Zn-dependent protease with chaperone function